MSTNPKDIIVEYGINLHGNSADTQYQKALRALPMGSAERRRLEDAWRAYMLGRTSDDVNSIPPPVPNGPNSTTSATAQGSGLAGVLSDRRVLWGALAIAALVIVYFVSRPTGVPETGSGEKKVDPPIKEEEKTTGQVVATQTELTVAPPPIDSALVQAAEQKKIAGHALETSDPAVFIDDLNKLKEHQTVYGLMKAAISSTDHKAGHHKSFLSFARAIELAIRSNEAEGFGAQVLKDMEDERGLSPRDQRLLKLQHGHEEDFNPLLQALANRSLSDIQKLQHHLEEEMHEGGH